MYSGDLFISQASVLAKLVAIPMATANIRIYTPSGFVVASDGRTMNSETKTITNDHFQKIFRAGSSLAMSFAGAARLGVEPLFDFIGEFTSATQTVSVRRYTTLQEYAKGISNIVQRKLEAAIMRGGIELPSIPSTVDSDYGETIVVVFLDGYLETRPNRVRVRFCHENRELLPPHVATETLTSGLPIIYGIKSIGDRLISGDPSLSHYMQDIELDPSCPDELATAIKFSRAFIEACGGPEAQLVDPEKAASIGGHTHVASITRQFGFTWEIGPTTL